MGKPITFQTVRDMPPMAVSLADMTHNQTGSWRYLRPIYLEKLAPCRVACPAGNDIPRALALISEDRFSEAWKLFRETNPFPGVCGRVCYHPCEISCNRKDYDEAVSVAALERLVADACFDLKDTVQPDERRAEQIAVVGSGPAGLSCAYFLARAGFPVTVFEAEAEPGGMLRVGIPQYRLPREVLNKEIERITALGVELKLRTRIGSDIDLEKLWQQYEAVFIASGAHRSRPLEIPGENEKDVLAGLEFLKTVNSGQRVSLGRNALVIGGGNTAMDAARAALRLGAQPTVVYRRTRAEMPAIPEEIAEAEHEGIEFVFLAAPRKIRHLADRLEVEFIRMKLGKPDASGRSRPVPVPGSEFVMKADSVLKAIGEEPELSFMAESIETSAGIVMCSHPEESERAGIFVGGDARTGPSTVVQAIASGKEAARAIQRYLQKEGRRLKPFPAYGTPLRIEEGSGVRLNFDYFARQPRAQAAPLSVGQRITDFSEVKAPLTSALAIAEARRCFSCGVCNFCDNCRVFCPDVAITRNSEAYEVNLEFCKGCGICAQECPRGVISLIEEER